MEEEERGGGGRSLEGGRVERKHGGKSRRNGERSGQFEEMEHV